MAPSLAKIAKEDALLKAMVTDLSGKFRELIFPSKYIKELCNTGMAYDGSSFIGINTINTSDSILLWDETTIRKCPDIIAETSKTEYWIICDIIDTKANPHPNCARSKLKELQAKLAKKWDSGNLYVWAEPEAYFIDDEEELLNTDWMNQNYFNSKASTTFLIAEITNVLMELWYDIERSHTEVWQNQFEINWKFDNAVYNADKIQLFKLICQKVAKVFDREVTFLPKPFPNRNGSGMHHHISVSNSKENLFYANSPKTNYFSKEALSFLQGIIDNIRAISAISNKAEASYPRLVPWFEAPNIIAIWAKNRSAACRVPIASDPKTLKKALRAEFRFPDPLANPYLLASAFIAWWLSGLDKKTKFEWFIEEDLFSMDYKTLLKKGYKFMPRNLWEAYGEYISNDVLKKNLWESIFESYGDIVLAEIDECQSYANVRSMEKHFDD